MKKLFLAFVGFCQLRAEGSSDIFHQNLKDTITLDLADNTNTSLNMPFQLPLYIESSRMEEFHLQGLQNCAGGRI